nr:ATP-binding cassette domain-containing protein [Entomospira nematocera]
MKQNKFYSILRQKISQWSIFIVEQLIQPEPRLKVQSLVKFYKSYLAVDNISFELYPGEIVGLLGTNGAGKSSIFKMITGFLPWHSGKILLDDIPLPPHSPEIRARRKLAYMTQEPSIFRRMSVENNLLSSIEMLYPRKDESMQQLHKLTEEFNLKLLLKQPASTLSGGERRRLELARALAIEPKVLLLDEPFAGVDLKYTQELASLITPLRERGLAILITDHNAKEILNIADRILLVHQGRLVAESASSDILHHPQAHLYFSNIYH